MVKLADLAKGWLGYCSKGIVMIQDYSDESMGCLEREMSVPRSECEECDEDCGSMDGDCVALPAYPSSCTALTPHPSSFLDLRLQLLP